jgi:foldase protein PrsA
VTASDPATMPRLMPKIRSLLALCALVAIPLTLAACGDSVPGNAVARVGDTSITKTQFNHWLQVAAISLQGTPTSGKRPQVDIPQPPDFTKCVAQKRASAPKPAKGQKAPTTAQFKQQCKAEYEGLRDQVLEFLISAQWVQGEAKDEGLKVTGKEVQSRFNQLKKQSFQKEKDFQNFLVSSGMTMDDLLFRVRNNLLSDKLRTKIQKGTGTVTEAQIQAYYKKNKARFAQPQRRDLRLVLTKTRAAALQAKAAIQSGQSFKTVARQFSIDQTTKNQGGVLLAVTKGTQEKALDEAIFKASKGVLTGPIKTAFGYYIFKVQKITPASQQTLKQAHDTIRQILISQNQQKAFDKFRTTFRKKWKGKTNCRSGYVIQDCKNAPPAKTSSTVPPGAVAPPPTPPAQP